MRGRCWSAPTRAKPACSVRLAGTKSRPSNGARRCPWTPARIETGPIVSSKPSLSPERDRARLRLDLVAELEKLSSPTEDTLYNLACIHALAKAGIDKDKRLPPIERNKRSEAQAARALKYLEEAKKRKLFDDKEKRDWLGEDDDLKSLRGRDDFRQFLNGLPNGKTGTK